MNKLIPWVAGAILLGSGYAWWSHVQQQKGAQEVLLKQERARGDSLTKVLATKTAVFKKDTVRVFRSITTIDTMVQTRIDTAVVHQTDTVKITIREATAIQDTLHACREIIRSCASIQQDLRALLRSDTTTINLLKAQRPSAFWRWTERSAWATALIYSLSRR